MDLALEQLSKEEEELEKLNQQLKTRAQKFGAQFTPLSLTDYKLFKIQKARETGNIGYLSNILLQQIQDLQQRKQTIRKRLQSFYPELQVQPGDKYFEERQTPNLQSVELKPCSWHIFGVDYMSNEKIRNYFNINPHFKIEWINDSSCNLTFNSPQQAQSSIMPIVKGEGMRDQSQTWYELPDYEVEGIRRKLFCRQATSADAKKRECHGHNSQYYQWMINKQKLNNYVKKKASHEIMKTKGINRQGRHHMVSKDATVKREKKEQESSSSGVDESEQMAKE